MALARISLILCILGLLVPCMDAEAAYRGLFLLGGLRQSLDLNYLYTGQESSVAGRNAKTSSRNRFRENYDLGLPYAVLSPRLLNGNINLGVELNQTFFSGATGNGSANDTKLRYSVDGVFLDRQPYTLGFFVRSDFNQINPSFSKGYDVTSDSYGFSFDLANFFVPLEATYQHSSSKSSGAVEDRENETSQLAIRSSFKLANTPTEISLTRSEHRTRSLTNSAIPATGDIAFTFIARNSLLLDNKNLSSSFSYVDQKNISRRSTVGINETFTWALGKALTFGAGYSGSFFKTEDNSASSPAETLSHAGVLSLSHRLFQNLATGISVNARKSSQPEGDDQTYGGAVTLTYNKKINPATNMLMSYSEIHNFTKNDFGTRQVQVVEEPLVISGISDMRLRYPDLVRIVLVQDATDRGIRYQEGLDFDLVPDGRFTRLVFSDPSLEGRTVLVTYIYNSENSREYETFSRNLSLGLSLANGIYRFGASAGQSGQIQLSGIEQPTGSDRQTHYTVEGAYEKRRLFATLKFAEYQSDIDPYRYLEGTARTSYTFRNNFLTLQARDRYTMRGTTEQGFGGYDENVFSLSGGLSRSLFAGSLRTTAVYARTSGKMEREDITLDGTYRWMMGKLSLQLTGKVHFRNTAGYSLRDDSLNLHVRRVF